MSEDDARRMERIDLAQADDARDVIHRAVACLSRKGTLLLPTESGYGWSASGLSPEAVARLGPAGDLALVLKGGGELPDWAPQVSEVGLRLARRAWPGPLTLVVNKGASERGLAGRLPVPVRDRIVTAGKIALRCPDHPVVGEVLPFLVGPLVLGGADTRALSADEALRANSADLVLDDGPLGDPLAPTVVLLEEDGWKILEVGAIEPDEVSQLCGFTILFVCTGNTCRSPMAEAICKAMLAKRLGCSPEELGANGYTVLSAGVAARDGMPAAANAIEAVREWDGCLEGHASQQASKEIIRWADLVLAMTRDHLDALLDEYPEASDRARVLHSAGADIADPIGASADTYRNTAKIIAREIEKLLDEMGL